MTGAPDGGERDKEKWGGNGEFTEGVKAGRRAGRGGLRCLPGRIKTSAVHESLLRGGKRRPGNKVSFDLLKGKES